MSSSELPNIFAQKLLESRYVPLFSNAEFAVPSHTMSNDVNASLSGGIHCSFVPPDRGYATQCKPVSQLPSRGMHNTPSDKQVEYSVLYELNRLARREGIACRKAIESGDLVDFAELQRIDTARHTLLAQIAPSSSSFSTPEGGAEHYSKQQQQQIESSAGSVSADALSSETAGYHLDEDRDTKRKNPGTVASPFYETQNTTHPLSQAADARSPATADVPPSSISATRGVTVQPARWMRHCMHFLTQMTSRAYDIAMVVSKPTMRRMIDALPYVALGFGLSAFANDKRRNKNVCKAATEKQQPPNTRHAMHQRSPRVVTL